MTKWVARHPNGITQAIVTTEVIAGRTMYWLKEDGYESGVRAATLIGLYSSLHYAKRRWWQEWGTGWRWEKVTE